MEFSTPKSGILDEQVPGEVLSAEQAERAELEAALAGADPVLAAQLRQQHERLASFRRAQSVRGGSASGLNPQISQFIDQVRQGVSQVGSDLVGLGQGLAQVPGQVLGGINENVVQPAVEGFSQFIDPVGFAQDQLAPASAAVSPLDETQPAMAPLPLGNLSPGAQVAAMQQETDLLNRTAADAAQQEALLAEFNRITAAASAPQVGLEANIINNMVATDAARRNADLAASLLTPQTQLNPLMAASQPLAIQNPTQAIPNLGAASGLVQRLAPEPNVPSLRPALARNQQNQIDQAGVYQRLSEAELKRLQSIQQQAAEAFIAQANQRLREPRDQ